MVRAGGMGTGGVAGMMWHLGEEEEPYGAQAITIRGAFSSRDARRRGQAGWGRRRHRQRGRPTEGSRGRVGGLGAGLQAARCRNVRRKNYRYCCEWPLLECRCGLLSPPLRLCREMSEALLWGPCVGCARGRSRDRRQAALLAKLREQRPDLGAGTASARY